MPLANLLTNMLVLCTAGSTFSSRSTCPVQSRLFKREAKRNGAFVPHCNGTPHGF